jgi:bacteriorhodopsin
MIQEIENIRKYSYYFLIAFVIFSVLIMLVYFLYPDIYFILNGSLSNIALSIRTILSGMLDIFKITVTEYGSLLRIACIISIILTIFYVVYTLLTRLNKVTQ